MLNTKVNFAPSRNIKESIAILRSQLRKNPKNLAALEKLGEILLNSGQYDEAVNCLQQYIMANPHNAKVFYNLGEAFGFQKKHGHALEAYKAALKLDINNVVLYRKIAQILLLDMQYAIAILYLNEALKISPKDALIHCGLARAYHTLGKGELALDHIRQAYEIDPQTKEYLSSILFMMHKLNQYSWADYQNIAKEYHQQYLSKLKPKEKYDFSERRDPELKNLRLGFVSSDFRKHPVGSYTYHLFEALIARGFHLDLYYTYEHPDDITKQFMNLPLNFHSVSKLNNSDLADKIYKDKIDILFDLIGFTTYDRLELFKYKPAPIQVEHLGYFGTTAIPEIDYIIADENLVHADEEQYFSEQVYKIQDCYVHAAISGLPEEYNQEAPCIKNGYITFGCTNTFHKISIEVLKTWARILDQVPNSKLLFDARTLVRDSNKDYIKRYILEAGIDLDRVILRGNFFREDFLKTYNDIDIALDPFPYAGGTSSNETLNMGVPLITYHGHNWLSRQSTSFLRCINCEELIAQNLDDYVAKAVALANNTDQIQYYRQNLRQLIQSSAMNLETHADRLAEALHSMWKKFTISALEQR